MAGKFKSQRMISADGCRHPSMIASRGKMSIDPGTRKTIAQRAIDRAKAHGQPIDEASVVVTLRDTWIRGDIDMRTVRERYLASLAPKEEERLSRQSGQDEIMDKKKGPTE
jgi:hypothetical protein